LTGWTKSAPRDFVVYIMAAGQLWLFPPSKPLVEKLGADFFQALPERPGVFLMCGRQEGVLYVGKAKNLRKRLASYRVANPERMSRKVIRLLNQVTRIEWDECRDEQMAEAREELLICVLMPKFNRAGKVWPRPPGAPISLAERRVAIRISGPESALPAKNPA
jgi:hypothetical protein